MDAELLKWVGGIAISLIGALLMLLYKVHDARISSKADAETVQSLEERITQMHAENKAAAFSMESRFRQDYATLNANFAHLTGRIDQVLTHLSRRSE